MRFLFILFLFPLCTQASISLEPYVGGGLAYSGELSSGFSVGSRVGYKNWGLTLGADISYSQFHTFDIGQEINNNICDSNQGKFGVAQTALIPCDEDVQQDPLRVYSIISVGPSVSFGLPLIIDAYASLTWSWVDKKISKFQQSFFLSGPGMKIGVSYLSLPFLQLNLELQGLLLNCNSSDTECQEQDSNRTNPFFIGQLYISIPISTGFL